MRAEPEVSQVKRLRQFITYARLAAVIVTIIGVVVLAVLSARVQVLVDEFNGSDRCRYPVGLSIGVVGCSPKELKPLGELLAGADAAMYANKQRRQQVFHGEGCAVGVLPRHSGGQLESSLVL